MAADRTGNRMGNRMSGDGPLPDPATIRDLNWAALNWAAHYSFLPGSSSPPRAPAFAFPESVRVSIARPEGESSERPAFGEFERPGVREIERPGRDSSARLELEKGEHPDSERRNFRRSLRKGVSAHPGREARGLQEVRRTSRKRKGKRPEREARDLQEREKGAPGERDAPFPEEWRSASGGRSYGAQGDRIQNPGEEDSSGHPAALGRLRGAAQGPREDRVFGVVWEGVGCAGRPDVGRN